MKRQIRTTFACRMAFPIVLAVLHRDEPVVATTIRSMKNNQNKNKNMNENKLVASINGATAAAATYKKIQAGWL